MSVSVPDPTETSSRLAPTWATAPLDRLFVGANNPAAELDHRAAEVGSQSIHHRPCRRAVWAAVAEDHRSNGHESFGAVGDRAVQHRLADADVDVGQSGVAVRAQGRQKGRGVGNGDHVGRADKSGRRQRRLNSVERGEIAPVGVRVGLGCLGVRLDGGRSEPDRNRCRGEVREEPGAHPGDHGGANGGGLLGQHPAHWPSEHAGLDRRPQVVARAAADDPYLTATEAERVESFDDVAQRKCTTFEHRPCDMRRCVVHREPEQAATHPVVPPRCRRPRQCRQEQHTVAGRWRRQRQGKDLGLRHAEQPGEPECAAAADESGILDQPRAGYRMAVRLDET